MLIFPAIDLYKGEAVRLLRGDYENMTVYDSQPVNTAKKFSDSGAEWIHIVDLEGAKTGEPVNLDTILRIHSESGLKCEVGGGVRDLRVIEKYINSGIDRIILGTAAITDKKLLTSAIKNFSSGKIAVGVDIRAGLVAVKGWREDSGVNAFDFCSELESIGVNFIICTDISRDGAMKGTNRQLYKDLSAKFNMNITASGGVSTLDDIKSLARMNLYGAIIGKAYYTGAINLSQAIEAAKIDN